MITPGIGNGVLLILAASTGSDDQGEQFLRDDEKLHILVNNAGIMAPPLECDARGTNLNSPPII